MKRTKKLVIGGIQNKIFSLILFTVILLTVLYMAVSLYHSSLITDLAAESGKRQQDSVTENTTIVMDQMVTQDLKRSNRMAALIADEMFSEVRQRVLFLGDYAESLLANPGAYKPKAWSEPDPADDGVWTAKVIFADGVDASDPAIRSKIGLLANMSQIMISMCPALRAANAYIGMPEGVHLSVSDNSSSWYQDGRLIHYDPRTRDWYQRAERSGCLVFTDGEYDANTGEYCIECAIPVYDPDGVLQAVIGTDLYLDQMQEVMQDSLVEGEYSMLINQSGKAVLPAQERAFPMSEEDRGQDLKNAREPALEKTVSDAMKGKYTEVTQGEFDTGNYYLTAAPIETTGWILVSAYSMEIVEQPVQQLLSSFRQIREDTASIYQVRTGRVRLVAVLLLIAVAVLILGLALVQSRKIVRPLNTITQRISELKGGDLAFRMEDAYRTGDEIEELAQSFASLSHKTVEYMEQIRKVTAEKERISVELSLATDIQHSMLPHIFPAFPERTEFTVFASMDPAKEVGGDFYDYFLVDNDHLCLVIADVSGKGVPGALFMMSAKIILQSIAMQRLSPSEVLYRMNKTLCSNNDAQMFVTVWMGILEISTGKLTAANAGHEYPILKQPGGAYEIYKDKHGFVIGGMDEIHFKEYELVLQPGAKLFVYTDGVPEATNGADEMFGTERMLDALNREKDDDPEQVIRNIHASVDRFVQGAEQFDDLTMMCIEYRG